MTDRMKGCVVAFSRDIRDDDVEPLVEAIKMLKGVGGVELSVADPDDWMNRERVRQEMADRLWKTLDSHFDCSYKYDLVENPKPAR